MSINKAADLGTIAEKANATRLEIMRHIWRSLELSRDCGQWLDSAQTLVPRSSWNEWLSNHFSGPASEARAYIQVYQGWGQVKQNFQQQNNCLIEDLEEVGQ